VYHIFNQIQNTVLVYDIGCLFLGMTLINKKKFGLRTVVKIHSNFQNNWEKQELFLGKTGIDFVGNIRFLDNIK